MKRRYNILSALSLSFVIAFGVLAACSDDGDHGDYVGLEHELIGISVGGEYKTAYTEGETFDVTGMEVTANYADEKNETVEFGDYIYTPSRALTVADDTVTVKYSGFSYDIAVTVTPPTTDPDDPDNPGPDEPGEPTDPDKPIEPELPDPPAESENGSIVVTEYPNKTSYYIGEEFDKTGLVITHNKKDGSSEVVTDFAVDKKVISAADVRNGRVTVKVTYQDMTVEFSVEAHEPKLVSLIVDKAPDKTKYFVGDILDPSGLEVKAVYEDGAEPKAVSGYFLLIDEERELDTYRLNVADREVTVVYIENGETREAVFEISVKAPAYSSLEITKDPASTAYLEGEHFDPRGMIVSAVYENGASRHVTDYSLSIGEHVDLAEYALEITDRLVTVTYTEDGVTHTANIDISVAETVLTGLVISNLPDKTEYLAGEDFDPAGLVVCGIYNNDDSLVRELEGWEVQSVALTQGMTTITVKYGELTAEVPISVFEKYKFEAESLGVEAKAGADPDVRYGFEYAGKDHTTVDRGIVSGMGFVANMASVNALTLTVHAESDCDAIFGMCYARHNGTAGSPEHVKTIVSKLTVGTEQFVIDPDAAIYGNVGGIQWLDFCETDAARIRLRKGENIIKIYTTGESRNFDYVTVKAPVKVTLSSELTDGHDWSDYYVVSVPTSDNGGEMYRYCQTCMTREAIALPPDLNDASKYEKGDTVGVTATKNGYTEYTYNGIAFKVLKSTEYLVENTFDLENATRNAEFNTSRGIKYNPPVTELTGKFEGAHGNSVENFKDRGGSEYSWTVYSPGAVDGRLRVRILGDGSEYNPSFSLLLIVNGKPVALDDGVYSRKVSEWQYLDVANISLEQGKNTITIQAIAGGFTYMDDVVIECPVTLVASESKLIKSIAVTQDPTKVVYACGEKFNPAGMVITATRADGTTFAVERFKYDNSPLDTVGAVEITVWAENCEVKIPVTVEDIKVTSMRVNANPNKTVYIAGETLDVTGLEIIGTYNNGTESAIALDDLTFDKTVLVGGDSVVNVSLGELTTSFNITVKYDTRLEAEGAVWTGDAKNYPENDNLSGISRVGDWKGTTATFDFYVANAAAVELSAVFVGIESAGPVTQFIADIAVDGTSYKGMLTATFKDNGWNGIFTADLATFNVSAGKHTLVITGASGDTAKNSNFDYLRFVSNGAEVIWFDEKDNGKIWSDFVVTEMPTKDVGGAVMRMSSHGDLQKVNIPADLDGGSYTLVSSAEATEYAKGYAIYRYNDIEFKVYKDNAVGAIEETYFCGADASYTYREGVNWDIKADYYRYGQYTGISNGNYTVGTFEIYADNAATADLYVKLTAYANNVKAEAHRMFGVKLNGKSILVDRSGERAIANTNDFNGFTNIYIGTVELAKGKNTIEIEFLRRNRPSINYSGIALKTSTKIYWYGEELYVAERPTKLKYMAGESFDPSGMVIRYGHRTYKNSYNNSKYPSSMLEFCEPIRTVQVEVLNGDSLAAGQKSVTVKFGEQTIDVAIDNVYHNDIRSLRIDDAATLYGLSMELTKNDFAVFAVRSNGEEVMLGENDITVAYTEWKAGEVTVTVSLVIDPEIKATYTVNVVSDIHDNVFEAEKFEAKGFKDISHEYEGGSVGIEIERSAVGKWVTSYNTKGGTLTFKPYNATDKKAAADVRFRFASNKDTKDFSKIFSLTVNGKEVAIASKPFATNDGWFGYKMTDVLARIVLEPGENVIVLTALGGGDANLDSVVLTASAELVLTACKDGHAYTDWFMRDLPTEEADGAAYRFCAECGKHEYLTVPKGTQPTGTTAATETTRGTATYTVNGNTVTVYTDAATGELAKQTIGMDKATVGSIDGRNKNSSRNDDGSYSAGQMIYSDYTFTVNVDADGTAAIELVVDKSNCAFGKVLTLEVNGKTIAMDPTVKSGNVEDGKVYLPLANAELASGENTVRIVNYGARINNNDQNVKVFGIRISSAAGISVA